MDTPWDAPWDDPCNPPGASPARPLLERSAARRSFRLMSPPPGRPDRTMSEIFAQVGRGVGGGALHVEGGDEPPLLVHEIHDGGVVHGVVAAFERHFLVVDAVGLGDRGERRRVAREA